MIYTRAAKFVTIRNNIIHGNLFNNGEESANSSAIVLHRSDDVVIEDNLFYDNAVAYYQNVEIMDGKV